MIVLEAIDKPNQTLQLNSSGNQVSVYPKTAFFSAPDQVMNKSSSCPLTLHSWGENCKSFLDNVCYKFLLSALDFLVFRKSPFFRDSLSYWQPTSGQLRSSKTGGRHCKNTSFLVCVFVRTCTQPGIDCITGKVSRMKYLFCKESIIFLFVYFSPLE